MKNKKGFTLIELIVVLGLMAAITTVAIISYRAISLKRKQELKAINEQQMITAAKQYFAANEYFLDELKEKDENYKGYVSLGTLVQGGYVTQLRNPVTEKLYNKCSIVTVNNKKEYEFKEFEKDGEFDTYKALGYLINSNGNGCVMEAPTYINAKYFGALKVSWKGGYKIYTTDDKSVASITTNVVAGSNWINSKNSNFGKTGKVDFNILTTNTVKSGVWGTTGLSVSNNTIDTSKDISGNNKINQPHQVTLSVTFKGNKTVEVPIELNIDTVAPTYKVNQEKIYEAPYKKLGAYNPKEWLNQASSANAVENYLSNIKEEHSGIGEVKHTIDGATLRQDNRTAANSTYTATNSNNNYRRVINAEGSSSIIFTVCDVAGNCTKSSEYSVKKDITPPSLTVNRYIKTTKDSLDLSSNVRGLTVNNNDAEWLKDYVFYKAKASDNVSKLDYIKHEAGGATENVSYTGANSAYNDDKTEGWDYRNVNANNYSTVNFKACDQAGNCTISNRYVTLDHTYLKITTYAIDGNGKDIEKIGTTCSYEHYPKNGKLNEECKINGGNWINKAYYDKGARKLKMYVETSNNAQSGSTWAGTYALSLNSEGKIVATPRYNGEGIKQGTLSINYKLNQTNFNYAVNIKANVDWTPPSVTINRTNGSITFNGSATDTLSGVARASITAATSKLGDKNDLWDKQEPAVKGTVSLSRTDNGKNRTLPSDYPKFYTQAVDAAGNFAISSGVNRYLLCEKSSTKYSETASDDYAKVYYFGVLSNSKRLDGTSRTNCSIGAVTDFDTHGWGIGDTHYEGPVSAYTFKEYQCSCNVDDNHTKLNSDGTTEYYNCGYNKNKYSEITGQTHREEEGYYYSYIIYQNNANGVNACKAGATYYVNQVCENGFVYDAYENKNKSPFPYQGIYWYYGSNNSDKNTQIFLSDNNTTEAGIQHRVYYHNGTQASRNRTATDITNACKKACRYKFHADDSGGKDL